MNFDYSEVAFCTENPTHKCGLSSRLILPGPVNWKFIQTSLVRNAKLTSCVSTNKLVEINFHDNTFETMNIFPSEGLSHEIVYLSYSEASLEFFEASAVSAMEAEEERKISSASIPIYLMVKM